MLFGGFFYSPSPEYPVRFRRIAGIIGLRLWLRPDREVWANRFINRPKRSYRMGQYPEQRDDARIRYKSPVKVEDLVSGITLGARMVNYSRTGLSFETNEHLHQGAEIYIGIENSPYASPASRSYECYRAKIIWRRELETVFFKYGYGVRYIFTSDEEISQSNELKGRKDLRKHPRQSYSISIRFDTQKQILQGLTKNISPSGVFIKTDDSPNAREILTLFIPLKGEQKAEIKGRVVWSNQVGCGVKFLSIVKK